MGTCSPRMGTSPHHPLWRPPWKPSLGIIYFTQDHYTHWQATSVYLWASWAQKLLGCIQPTVSGIPMSLGYLVYSRCSISVHVVNNGSFGRVWYTPAIRIAAFIADVMVIMPLGWKTYRGVDKSFILCGFCTGALPNSVSRLCPFPDRAKCWPLAQSPRVKPEVSMKLDHPGPVGFHCPQGLPEASTFPSGWCPDTSPAGCIGLCLPEIRGQSHFWLAMLREWESLDSRRLGWRHQLQGGYQISSVSMAQHFPGSPVPVLGQYPGNKVVGGGVGLETAQISPTNLSLPWKAPQPQPALVSVLLGLF